MKALKIRANAKINLSLSVLSKRSDGYHELDTVMQSISLYDTVYIKKADDLTVTCGEINESGNIAYKTAKLFFEETGINGGAQIKIEKRIPAAAGLGGGSADAAAVLDGLNRLYGAELSYNCLLNMAVRLGADVPFMLKGGTARAKGIGEALEPLKSLSDCFFIIAKAGEKLSTAEMFRQLDSTDYFKPDINKTVSALNSGDFSALTKSLENSFSVLWENSVLKPILNATNPCCVSLSGSGPAFFAIYRDKDTTIAAENMLKKENITCFLCEPQNNGLIFE